MDADLVVVGAGMFGLTVAQRCAEELGLRVLVLDRRDHIGGNAYSELEPTTGIEVHRYGAHLFHTSNDRGVGLRQPVHRRSPTTEHRVLHDVPRRGLPMPINLGTINQFFRAAMTPRPGARAGRGAGGRGRRRRAPRTWRSKAISLVGRPLYEAFIRGYTAKQWQTDPRELPAEVITRLPVRYTYDNRYFSDTHEGLPTDGYTAWIERMADHPLIEVRLDTDFFDRAQPVQQGATRRPGRRSSTPGPIDRYFDYAEGALRLAHPGLRDRGARRSGTSRARR